MVRVTQPRGCLGLLGSGPMVLSSGVALGWAGGRALTREPLRRAPLVRVRPWPRVVLTPHTQLSSLGLRDFSVDMAWLFFLFQVYLKVRSFPPSLRLTSQHVFSFVKLFQGVNTCSWSCGPWAAETVPVTAASPRSPPV